METLTEQELDILIFLANTRLKYESRRKSYFKDGIDLTSLKVRELHNIKEKLERMKLAK